MNNRQFGALIYRLNEVGNGRLRIPPRSLMTRGKSKGMSKELVWNSLLMNGNFYNLV